MLVKGMVKGNTLITELGQFFISRKGNNEVTGVFELSNIQASSIERPVEVDGFSTVVKIPVTKATISAIYVERPMAGNKQKTSQSDTKTVASSLELPLADPAEEEQEMIAVTEPNKPKVTTVESTDSIEETSVIPDVKPVVETESTDGDLQDIDLEMGLFGCPINELEDFYKIDSTLTRAEQTKIKNYFQTRNVGFLLAKQEWDLRELKS